MPVKIVIPPAAERAKQQREHDATTAKLYATSVRYDRRAGRLRVVLKTGAEVLLQPARASYLAKLTPAQLAEIELSPVGDAIAVPSLDLDLSLPELLREALGLELQQRRAGRVKSLARAAASQANGAKGGRPRKTPALR
jgi:hypothetical protein